MAPGRPPLYRLSRAFRALALAVLVALLLYVATAAASAAQVRPSDVHQGGSTTDVLANGTIVVDAAVNFTNPGYFPIDSIAIAAAVHQPDGSKLGVGSSPPVRVGPGATATIPLTVVLPLQFTGTEAALLTHDAQLPSAYWVNVTYAALFTAEVEVTSNLTWGAPFEALNATLGAPVIASNGTVTVPAEVTFENHARFAVSGTLTVRLAASNGTTCGEGRLPISAPSGAHFDRVVDVTVTCDARGGTVYAAFAGSPWTVALPPERIP
ncbi:MAG: hypothetical protein ACREDK_05305 [Thermoplasmata archaeon]